MGKRKRSNGRKLNTNIRPDTQKKRQPNKPQAQTSTLELTGKTYPSSRVGSILKKTIVIISFVVNVVSGYFLFHPRITPSIIMPENMEYPFEIFLNLTNTGHFEICDVECRLEGFGYSSSLKRGDPLTMYTHDPTGKLVGPKQINIKSIRPNHSESIELRRMFGLIAERAGKASFSVNIKYSVWYLPGKKWSERPHHYEMLRTVTGAYSWHEKSL